LKSRSREGLPLSVPFHEDVLAVYEGAVPCDVKLITVISHKRLPSHAVDEPGLLHSANLGRG